MSLHDSMIALAEQCAEALRVLLGRLRDGLISTDEFRAASAATVQRANARAYALADLSLTAYLEMQRGTPVAALGLSLPPDDRERILKGLNTLLAALGDGDDITERVERYGRSEPLSAFQDAYGKAMRRRNVPGYVRVLSPGACQLCQWLYKDGYVYPSDKSFHRHEGCTCYPQPVSPEGTE